MNNNQEKSHLTKNGKNDRDETIGRQTIIKRCKAEIPILKGRCEHSGKRNTRRKNQT